MKHSFQALRHTPIQRYANGQFTPHDDRVAVEEPLEIRVAYPRRGKLEVQSLSITMRTPGHDEALALGFLLSEGLIRKSEDVKSVVRVPHWDKNTEANQIQIELTTEARFDPERLQRHFYMTSSCGVCGKASVEALAVQGATPFPKSIDLPTAEVILALPNRLRHEQRLFQQTGGVHAAGWFNTKGELSYRAEDIGRHNAVDKVVGQAFQNGEIPLREGILQLSGRVSFELVQKGIMAGIPIIAAVGAPSSLAIQTAKEFGMRLIGFIGKDRFNVYN